MSTPPSPDLTVLARLREARQPLGLPDESIPSPEALLREAQFSRRALLPPSPAAWRLQALAWVVSLTIRLVLVLGAALILAQGRPELSPLPQLRGVSVMLGLALLAAAGFLGVTALLTRAPVTAPEAATRLRRSWTPARLLRLNLVTLAVLVPASLALLGLEEAARYGLPSELRLFLARGAGWALLLLSGVELLSLLIAAGLRVLRASTPQPELVLPRGQRLLARAGALLTTGLAVGLCSLLAVGAYLSVWPAVALPQQPSLPDPFARAAESLDRTPHFWEMRAGVIPLPILELPGEEEVAVAGVVAEEGFGDVELVSPARLRLVQRFELEEGGARLQEFAATRTPTPGALTPRILELEEGVPGLPGLPLEDPLRFLGRTLGPLERTGAIVPAASGKAGVVVAPRGCDVYEGELRPDRLEALEARRLALAGGPEGAPALEPRLALERAARSAAELPRVSVRICLDPDEFPVLVERRQLVSRSRVLVTQLRPVREGALPLLPRGTPPPLPRGLGEITDPPARLGETLGRIFTN